METAAKAINDTLVAPTVTTPEVDVNDWTWSVAEQLSPGNPQAFIQRGIDLYNASNNTKFSLQPVNGVRMIVDGSHIISPEEMNQLNQMMLDAADDEVVELPSAE